MMNTEENPWIIRSQRAIYENPWIEVTEYEVINPSGGKGIYGKVHMKNLAVGILALDDDFNTWLVGQFRFPLNQYSWEIPEGGADPSDGPLAGAQRELLEETGLVARDWNRILEMHLSNSVTDEQAFIYMARGLEQQTPRPEETEQLIVKKLPFAEAARMVDEGLITDSMSVAAIQKIQILLGQGKLK